MNKLTTNRDLYLAIDSLSELSSDSTRSLEQFLLAFLSSSLRLSDRETLSLTEFYQLVASSFSSDVPAFEAAWRDQYDSLPYDQADYSGFRATLIRQIVDLREMDENGTLQNDMRYFGLKAPRNSDWYNFDPGGYLECAMAGAFGGWESGDETGRQFVPGHVAVLDEDGSIEFARPEDSIPPTVPMPVITWEQCKDFIICGQIYE